MSTIKKVKNLQGCGKAFYIAELVRSERKPLIVILGDESEIDEFVEDVRSINEYLNLKAQRKEILTSSFPSFDANERLKTLFHLNSEKLDCIVTTKEALNKPTTSKSSFKILKISIGQKYGYSKFIQDILSLGYEKEDFVEQEGKFSVRGEIVDVWSIQDEHPRRIVFCENTIETIKIFDVFTQKSIEALTDTLIIPAKEIEETSIQNWFAEYTIFSDIPDGFENQILHDEFSIDAEDLSFLSSVSYGGNVDFFLKDLRKYFSDGYEIVVFCSNNAEAQRLQELLYERNEKMPTLIVGSLSSGCVNPRRKIAIITFSEIFSSKYIKPQRLPKIKIGKKIEGLWEIEKGDYVVHEDYGIGKYVGLKRISVGEFESDFITIEYEGKDLLYVPVHGFRKVQKYIGIEGKRPKLSSLDTPAWELTKKAAKKEITELAKQLFKIYSQRTLTYRPIYKDDLFLEKEVELSFPYKETEDQLKAIEDVKKDLKKPYPADRLILGDVGYGKTEVAIRAALKCVISGKQVAVLCPTTILACQHFRTFQERLSNLPVNIALLTRFQPKKEQIKIIEDLYTGMVDILIGTHRILQKDIKFKNLAMLIIDDEHKFGVRQKEKIKMMTKNIDTFSLTATPIPRTLSMALEGLKDISLIETPPEGRLPVQTYVLPYDRKIIEKAIKFEISRQGQVFYVHNRIQTIHIVKQNLKAALPDVNFEVIHAKMKPREIEKIMYDFLEKKIDCLISTTIIEAGLDIPNVNTMIIENINEFGLAQLYQLRGRIGRATKKAYCYLLYTPGTLTENAKKRLSALFEFSTLSSAFKLALRDLEIRGAGEVLGIKQHGFIRNIGLELFSKMLSREVSMLKKQPVEEEFITEIEIPLNAFIPEGYIPQEDLRIYFYKQIMKSKTIDQLHELMDEMTDRFGEFPTELKNLFDVAELQIISRNLKIKKIKQKNSSFVLEIATGPKSIEVNARNISKLKEKLKNELF